MNTRASAEYTKKYMIVAHLWFYFTFIFPSYIFVQIWYPLKASKETKINGQKDTAKWNQEVLIPRFLVHECHFLNATSPIIKRIIQLYYHVSINELKATFFCLANFFILLWQGIDKWKKKVIIFPWVNLVCNV